MTQFFWFDLFLDSRVKICQIFCWYFGPNDEINWPLVVPLLGRSGLPNRPQLLLPRAGRSMWANCVFHKFCTNLLDRVTKELYRRISADYLCTACPNDNNLGTIELITRSANNCRHAIISRGLYIFNTLNGGQFCSLKGDFS